MSKRHIHIGVENSERGYGRFIKAWRKAENNEIEQTEIHLNFEDFSVLLSNLTPKRLELLKSLRQLGPLSVRGLAKQLNRNYKNVYSDVNVLEEINLIIRTDDDLIAAPWDVIDTHLQLVA